LLRPRSDLARGLDENGVLGKERAEGCGISMIEGIETAHMHRLNLLPQHRAIFRVRAGDRQERKRAGHDQFLAPKANRCANWPAGAFELRLPRLARGAQGKNRSQDKNGLQYFEVRAAGPEMASLRARGRSP
jgi:hypothetical protein